MQKKSLLLLSLKLVKMPLSIITLALTAKLFGVNINKDIWLLCLAIVTTIDLAVWGPVNETFRAKFVINKECNGENSAILGVQSLLFYIFLVSVLICGCVMIFPQGIIYLFSNKNFSVIELEKMFSMLRMLAPFLLLNQSVLICTSILNAYDKFYIPEISSFISQIINFFLIFFFGNKFGIYSLVYALYCSNLILILFLFYELYKLRIKLYRFSIPSTNGFLQYFKYALPFFIPYFIGQLSGLVEKYLAVKLPVGTLSILDFSRRVPDILNGILISVILTILVPTLTKFFVNQEKDQYNISFLETFRLGLLFLMAFNIFFFSSSGDLLPVLYESKSISAQDMLLIVELSKYFSLAMFAVFFYIIFGMTMLSINKGKLYALYGSLAQVIIIIFNFFLVKYLKVYTFPISFFVAHTIAAFLMFMQYPYHKKEVLKTFVQYALFGVVVFFLFTFILKFVFTYDVGASLWQKVMRTVWPLFLLTALFLGLGYLFKIKEILTLKQKFIKRKI